LFRGPLVDNDRLLAQVCCTVTHLSPQAPPWRVAGQLFFAFVEHDDVTLHYNFVFRNTKIARTFDVAAKQWQFDFGLCHLVW
jgi:hypothetical protein